MRILVTGASSGIGACVCDAFIENKHNVEGIDIKKPKNTQISFNQLDLSKLDEVDRFVRGADLDFDALIYCAGIREICDPIELTTEIWTNILNVNLSSAFLLSKALIKSAIRKKKKLNIVNLASVSGIQAEPDRAAYVSSKFALIGLTKQLALQFGSKQVRVNAIAPGIIETPLTQEYFYDSNITKYIKESTPVGSWGQVANILPLIEMCLSNDYLNGSVLVCDGGWTAGKKL